MDWSLGNIVATGLRVIQHREEVARVGQKAIKQIVQAEELWVEVRELIAKIAPQLLVDIKVIERLPSSATTVPQYDVKWVQQALNHLLHPEIEPPLKVDGMWGQKTSDATKLFQHRNNLKPDGWLGPETMAALDRAIRAAHGSRSR